MTDTRRLRPGTLRHRRSRLRAGGGDHHGLLKSQVPEALSHDARAERAGGARYHPFRNNRPVLSAESFRCPHNRTCCGVESFAEGSVIGRGIIGTFSDSSGNCYWRYSNHAGVRPELIRILHLLFPLPRELRRHPLRATGSRITISMRQHRSQYPVERARSGTGQRAPAPAGRPRAGCLHPPPRADGCTGHEQMLYCARSSLMRY
jgi:hypothetical protein